MRGASGRRKNVLVGVGAVVQGGGREPQRLERRAFGGWWGRGWVSAQPPAAPRCACALRSRRGNSSRTPALLLLQRLRNVGDPNGPDGSEFRARRQAHRRSSSGRGRRSGLSRPEAPPLPPARTTGRGKCTTDPRCPAPKSIRAGANCRPHFKFRGAVCDVDRPLPTHRRDHLRDSHACPSPTEFSICPLAMILSTIIT